MLVKIISGTYGHRPILPNGQKSHYVIPVRAGEAPIDVEKAEGERLIGLGVAEAVQAEKIKAPKQEPVEKAPEAENEGVSLEEMSFNELKALAQENGVDVSGIRSKSGLIEAINAAEEVPSFDAQDVVD
jgi:hypothetical protein